MEKKIVKTSDLKGIKDLKGRMAEEHRKSVSNNMVMQEDLARQKAIVLTDLMSVDSLVVMLQTLPEDAKVVRFAEDVTRNKKFLFILSKEFSLLEDGESVPEIKFVYDKTGKIDSSHKEAKGFLDALEDL